MSPSHHLGSLKIGPIIALLLSAIACLGADWADTWESITRTAADVRSIEADFVQEKHLDILTRPLVSRGRLVFSKPASLRWEYLTPLKSLLLMHDGRTRQYVEREGRLAAATGPAMEALPMVMAEITNWLSGRYRDSADFKAELVAGQKIVLFPRDPALAGMIQKIELAFDDIPGMIRTVTIVESEASVTILNFQNPQLNPQISETVFQEP
jgi:outer membrane lipoprotein-sorting protein